MNTLPMRLLLLVVTCLAGRSVANPVDGCYGYNCNGDDDEYGVNDGYSVDGVNDGYSVDDRNAVGDRYDVVDGYADDDGYGFDDGYGDEQGYRSDERWKRAFSFLQSAWKAILKGAHFFNIPGTSQKIFLKRGTYEDALKDFRSLSPKVLGRLEEGGLYGKAGNVFVYVRPGTNSKAPALGTMGKDLTDMFGSTNSKRVRRRVYYVTEGKTVQHKGYVLSIDPLL